MRLPRRRHQIYVVILICVAIFAGRRVLLDPENLTEGYLRQTTGSIVSTAPNHNAWSYPSWVPPKPKHCVDSTRTECGTSCALFDDSTGLQRKLKILIFVDPVFLDVFLNWLHFYRGVCGRNNGIANLEVVCMGNFAEAGRILGYYGVECSSLSFDLTETASSPPTITDNHKSSDMSESGQPPIVNIAAEPDLWADKNLPDSKKMKKLHSIWDQRLSIITALLESGVDVMLTDGDALWLRNPFREIEFYSRQSDIIASKGYAPWDISMQWGASLCMGFIYFKASPFTVELFRRINHAVDKLKVTAHSLNRTNAEIDDQHLINRELYAWNISWPPKMTVEGARSHTGHVRYADEGGNNIENNNTNGIVESSESVQLFNVTLLPHSSYVRYCVPYAANWLKNTVTLHREIRNRLSSAKVAHCQLASGRQETKEVFLRMFKLWKHNYSNFVGVLPAKLTQATQDPFFYSDEVSMKNQKFGSLFEARVASHNPLHQYYEPGEINIAPFLDEQKIVLKKERKVIESMIVLTPYEQFKLYLRKSWQKAKNAVYFATHPRASRQNSVSKSPRQIAMEARKKQLTRQHSGRKGQLRNGTNSSIVMLRNRTMTRNKNGTVTSGAVKSKLHRFSRMRGHGF